MNTKLPTFARKHIQRKPTKKLVKKMTEIYHSHETSGPLLKHITITFSFRFLACVANVSVWFRSKEGPRNGILGFGRARNETRAKK